MLYSATNADDSRVLQLQKTMTRWKNIRKPTEADIMKPAHIFMLYLCFPPVNSVPHPIHYSPIKE
jgi:hypothetical protein